MRCANTTTCTAESEDAEDAWASGWKHLPGIGWVCPRCRFEHEPPTKGNP